MSIQIRKGYSVSSDDVLSHLLLKKLESEKLISTSVKKSVTCNRCKNRTLLNSNNIENFIICSNCNKRQNISKTNSENEISKINYDKIIQNIDSMLSDIENVYDKNSRYWKVKIDGKIIPLLILEISDSNYIMANAEKQSSLFIMLDSEKHAHLLNQFNKSQFVTFIELLEDKSLLIKQLQNVTTIFDTNYSIELENKFDELRSSLTPTQFEHFCVDLLEQIKTNYQKLQTFYGYLARFQNTILNSKIIPMGGPANPDFVIIDLLKYLQSGLQPEKFGEAKRYGGKTTFTWEKYSAAIMHGNASDALFLVSTTDIQFEIWRNILENNRDGKFKYVLLDKPLMLILIKCLGLENIMEDHLNSK